MIFETIALGQAKLTVYARDNSPEISAKRRYPAVLVLPGGGYEHCSDREAEPVALPFLAAGCTAAVLRYSVAPARHPAQLHEAATAIAYLRKHADDCHVDTARIFVCGFSAGGHLAAMLGCLWHETPQKKLARPTGMILCYPVISGGEYAHRGSFQSLTGGNATLTQALSLEKRVDKKTAPAFIWTTADDSAVPAMNSILMAQAMAAQGIPYTLHIFPQGAHGLSMAEKLTAPAGRTAMVNSQATRWFSLAMEWLRQF
jgi:acetyl esterase/lipase